MNTAIGAQGDPVSIGSKCKLWPAFPHQTLAGPVLRITEQETNEIAEALRLALSYENSPSVVVDDATIRRKAVPDDFRDDFKEGSAQDVAWQLRFDLVQMQRLLIKAPYSAFANAGLTSEYAFKELIRTAILPKSEAGYSKEIDFELLGKFARGLANGLRQKIDSNGEELRGELVKTLAALSRYTINYLRRSGVRVDELPPAEKLVILSPEEVVRAIRKAFKLQRTTFDSFMSALYDVETGEEIVTVRSLLAQIQGMRFLYATAQDSVDEGETFSLWMAIHTTNCKRTI